MTKILVIEDETPVRASIVDLLKMEDFETVSAENGLIGFGLAKKELPDLIICDVVMPEMDGYEVLNLLHQDPCTEGIPFIFLSAKADRDDLRQGMNLGAEDYITKPFSCDELLKVISTRLSRRDNFSHQYQQKLEELRQNLSHSLPHEFITPLSIILMSSEVILQRQAPLEEQHLNNIASAIQNAANSLHSLVKKFLIYSELEQLAVAPEKIEDLRRQETALAKQVVASVAQEKAQLLGREADLKLELHESSAHISEEWLTQLVAELVDNAFRYSHQHSPVRIINMPNPKQFILYITDSGRGMAAEYISNRGSYMQFERNRYEQQGIGLGLAIAQRVVELHGGTLDIESIPGQKTIVRLTLPR